MDNPCDQSRNQYPIHNRKRFKCIHRLLVKCYSNTTKLVSVCIRFHAIVRIITLRLCNQFSINVESIELMTTARSCANNELLFSRSYHFVFVVCVCNQ